MAEAGATEIVSTDVKPTRTGSDSRFEDAPPEHGRGATALDRTEFDVAPLRMVQRPERPPPRDPCPWSELRPMSTPARLAPWGLDLLTPNAPNFGGLARSTGSICRNLPAVHKPQNPSVHSGWPHDEADRMIDPPTSPRVRRMLYHHDLRSARRSTGMTHRVSSCGSGWSKQAAQRAALAARISLASRHSLRFRYSTVRIRRLK